MRNAHYEDSFRGPVLRGATMKALISGVTGQDGSYLADLLLSKGYEVHGIKRRSSSFNTSRVDHLMEHPNFHLHYGDLCDPLSIERIMAAVDPDEIYNLGAQSHVAVSFEMPAYTLECVAGGTLAMLEAMRHCCPRARFYQASSSEMFGNSPAPQSESTPFAPRSPYGVAKVAAHHMAVNYRESYGLHVSCGILFNHESPRRGETFVTRKISMAVAKMKLGMQDKLILGNMEAERDWGWAEEYVYAMWLMLRRDEPGDLVIGTGVTETVRNFAAMAFGSVDLDWTKYVGYDPHYERPAELHRLQADPTKARHELGWEYGLSVGQIAHVMVLEDMEALKCGK